MILQISIQSAYNCHVIRQRSRWRQGRQGLVEESTVKLVVIKRRDTRARDPTFMQPPDRKIR